MVPPDRHWPTAGVDIAAHHLSVAYETGVVASLEQAKSECVDWISKQGV